MDSVIIAGAGAAGLMAALTAAERDGATVTVLERQQRAGRKLLATGNGRCNLTNVNACADNYHGADPSFVRFALEAFSPNDTLDFFKGLGLVTVTQYGGRVYPLSDSANSVLDVLRYACESRGVRFICSSPVRGAKKTGRFFTVTTDEAAYEAGSLIIACGGAAGGKLGGVSDGYSLLGQFGHERTKIFPALCPVTLSSDYPRALKGVRADARVRLYSGRSLLCGSEGEVQFTDNGISGPAVFDVSRSASVNAGRELIVSLDLMRDYSADEIFNLLLGRRDMMPGIPAAELLVGMLHNRLARMLAKCAGIDASDCSAVTDGQLHGLAETVKDFRMPVKGTAGLDSAQVTAGGVSCSGFNPRTMESLKVPGLFACGEVLDIDGDCGGFNLQWAWSSGRLAGRLGK